MSFNLVCLQSPRLFQVDFVSVFESDFVSIKPLHRIVHFSSTILNWQSARLFIYVFIIIAIVACLTPFKSVQVHGTLTHPMPMKRILCRRMPTTWKERKNTVVYHCRGKVERLQFFDSFVTFSRTSIFKRVYTFPSYSHVNFTSLVGLACMCVRR